MRTLLERAKGSALDIIANRGDSVSTITLLSPHTQQIRSLDFTDSTWADIQRLSEIDSGPRPLLRTLKINMVEDFRSVGQLGHITLPSLPLFSNAVNLEEFVLRSQKGPFLNHFVFPNLTTFELSATLIWEEFQTSELLNFLEASPMLQTVSMKIIASILLDHAQRRVVVLPNVQTFSLVMDDGEPAYELAAQISCPSASHTSLIHEKNVDDITTDWDIQNIFPATASWNAIVHQYTRSPVEAISLEIKTPHDPVVSCTLTFQTSDATIIRLGLRISGDIDDDEDFYVSFGQMVLGVFSESSRIIRDYPLVHNARRLHILHRISIWDPEELILMAVEVGKLFRSIGPLEELILRGCDLHSYLTPFLNVTEVSDADQLIAFPPIKGLTISHPSMVADKEECMAAIVELAKSQHTLGVPFERVTVRARKLPTAMAEMLEPWAGVVDCREERYTQVHDE